MFVSREKLWKTQQQKELQLHRGSLTGNCSHFQILKVFHERHLLLSLPYQKFPAVTL